MHTTLLRISLHREGDRKGGGPPVNLHGESLLLPAVMPYTVTPRAASLLLYVPSGGSSVQLHQAHTVLTEGLCCCVLDPRGSRLLVVRHWQMRRIQIVPQMALVRAVLLRLAAPRWFGCAVLCTVLRIPT